ncbi:MAG: class I SAM-dependent methyltransferase [Anaerolineaceae bacterium]|jgi:SAM-dependent methyltransferase
MSETLVKQFYTAQVRNEWRRLVKDPYHRLELDTTLHFLEKYLSEAGLVLDAGGGPGRYTLELARREHAVVLLDLTPANLEFARRQIKKANLQEWVKDIQEGSIVDLSLFADNTFDAVVCTGGPLSHVLDPMERDRAISELIRVVKPGAPVFISVISRLAVLVIELAIAPFEIELPHFRSMRDTGDYQGGYGFTCCHFFLPEELRAAVAGKPVEVLEMVGLEGISSHHSRSLNQLSKNDQRWSIWLETHYQTCTHPAVVGISEHMLLVCRKN